MKLQNSNLLHRTKSISKWQNLTRWSIMLRIIEHASLSLIQYHTHQRPKYPPKWVRLLTTLPIGQEKISTKFFEIFFDVLSGPLDHKNKQCHFSPKILLSPKNLTSHNQPHSLFMNQSKIIRNFFLF